MGNFPHNWAEWNDKFREFTRGLSTTPENTTPAQLRYFLEGSEGIFKHKNKSVNYVFSHDGYCLFDFNSQKFKDDPERAEVEMKKQIALTLLAKGTPMLQIGDIIAHSKGGNENTYCNDDDSNYLDFSKAETKDTIEGRIYDFTKNMIEFKKAHNNNSQDTNCNTRFYKPDGSVVPHNDFSYWNNPCSNILCYKTEEERPTFVSISTDAHAFEVKLPEPSEGKKWHLICNTNDKDSFLHKGEEVEESFISQPYAVSIFEEY